MFMSYSMENVAESDSNPHLDLDLPTLDRHREMHESPEQIAQVGIKNDNDKRVNMCSYCRVSFLPGK